MNQGGVESVRTSSAAFWDDSMDDDGIWTEWGDSALMSPTPTTPTTAKGKQRMAEEEEELDEAGAEDAFIGGTGYLVGGSLQFTDHQHHSAYICVV